MEELELESLNRKLEIHGLEKEKRDEINATILATKLKMLQEEEKKVKELAERLRVDSLSRSEREIDDIRKKYEEREKLLVESKEQGLIAEAEYMQRLQNQREEMKAEIDKKTTEQRSNRATEELREMEQAYDRERILIMEQYANREISQAEYQQRLLDLEREFLAKRLMINGWTEEQLAKLKEQGLQKQIADREKEEKTAEEKGSSEKKGTNFYGFWRKSWNNLRRVFNRYRKFNCRRFRRNFIVGS